MNIQDAVFMATDLMEKHGLYARGWRFEFDRARRRHGLCNYRDKTISLSRAITEAAPESEVRDTVLHEIAHALVGPGKGHGPIWRAMARAIGARGERCASAAVIRDNDFGHGWESVPCGCGIKHKRYRRPGKGRYLCRQCRQAITWIDRRKGDHEIQQLSQGGSLPAVPCASQCTQGCI